MLRINADGTIPTDNPFYRVDDRQQPRHLGARACATRSPSRSAAAGAACSSTTSARTPGRRSTTASPAPTTAGRRPKAPTTDPRFTEPALHLRPLGGGCAITGGAFYTPPTAQFPAELRRQLLLRRLLRRLDPPARRLHPARSRPSRPASRRRSTSECRDDGRLYYLARGTGTRRTAIDYGGDERRPSPSHPASRTVRRVRPATFSVRASGPAPLRYQWQRNGANIPGATAQDYTLASAAASDNGARFRARRHQRLRQRHQQRGRC